MRALDEADTHAEWGYKHGGAAPHLDVRMSMVQVATTTSKHKTKEEGSSVAMCVCVRDNPTIRYPISRPCESAFVSNYSSVALTRPGVIFVRWDNNDKPNAKAETAKCV